jgi:hypothetical protein
VDADTPLLPPDFDALTIIDVTGAYGLLNVGWGAAGAADAISSFSISGLTLDLCNAGCFKRVNRCGVVTELAGTPHIVPTGSPVRSFTICKDGVYWTPYWSFALFEQAIQSSVNAGAKVKHIYASGYFDDDSETFTAQFALVVLH